MARWVAEKARPPAACIAARACCHGLQPVSSSPSTRFTDGLRAVPCLARKQHTNTPHTNTQHTHQKGGRVFLL